MTKRVWALLLALAMVASCLPAGVYAEGSGEPASGTEAEKVHADAEHICQDCAGTVTWTLWGDEEEEKTTLPSTSGHFVLTQSIDLSSTVPLDDESIVLCLNGKTVTASASEAANDGIYSLSGTAKLTIADCTEEAVYEDGVSEYKAGKLTGATASAIRLTGKASFYMYGGIFTGNRAQNGPAVYANGTGTLHLENVLITDNTATQTAAVHAQGGAQITIKNSTVTGNTSEDKFAGGVYITSAATTLRVSGRVVIDGNASDGNAGQQIARNLQFYNANNKLTVDGLTQGSRIQFCVRYNGNGDSMSAKTDPDQVIVFPGDKAPTVWDCSWVTYCDESVSWNDGNGNGTYDTDELEFGHWHGDKVYKPWNGTGALPTAQELESYKAADGEYYVYLTRDITCAPDAAANTYTGKKVHLCLCGQTVTQTNKAGSLFTLGKGTELTLEDCSAYYDTETGEYISGGITAVEGSTKQTGIIVNVGRASVFNLHSGKIFGVKNTVDGGSAVFVAKSNDTDGYATFNMRGGQLIGNQSAQGGAVYVANGTAAYAVSSTEKTYSQFNMTDGQILYNTATGTGGGGVYVAGKAQVTIAQNAEISNNTASSGGAIYATSGGSVSITGGTLDSNTANSYGGGAFVTGSNTLVTLDGGSISNNNATSGGGVIMQSSGSFKLVSGTVAGNTAAESGGGVYVSQGTSFVMVSGSITDNEAKDGAGVYLLRSSADCSGGSITENTAARNGGGIDCAGSSLILRGTNVQNNTAAGNGGGVYTSRSTRNSVDYDPTVTITAGTVSGNTGALGGGVYITADIQTLTLQGSPAISGNNGGNLYLAGQAVMTVGTLEDTARIGISAEVSPRVISGDVADTAKDYAKLFPSDQAYRSVKLAEGKLHFVVSSDHNHCLCNDSSDHCDHTAQVWLPWDGTTALELPNNYYLTKDITLTEALNIGKDMKLCLNGHSITGLTEGKRVIEITGKATVDITDHDPQTGTITGGSAAYGAAIWVGRNTTFNLWNGKITGSGNTAGNEKGSGAYGAIYLPEGQSDTKAGAVMNMYGGEISGNSAKHGGAIYMGGATDGAAPSTFTMYGGTIGSADAPNTATQSGGAICAVMGSVVRLSGGSIQGNQAGQEGGAIYLESNAAMTLDGTVISGSKAKNGGAIRAKEGATLVLKSGQISENTTSGNGGAVYADEAAAVTLAGAKITGNQADGYGGGIYGSAVAVTMSGGQISKNTAKLSGAGILVQGKGSLTLTGGEICENTATNDGGGIYISSNTGFTMSGGTINCNTAGSEGGGVYLLRTKATLTGGNIESNTAKDGGGLFASGSQADLTGVKLYKNAASGKGGAISANVSQSTYYPKLSLTDVTVQENTAGTKGGGVYAIGSMESLTITGNTVITGNTCENKANNLYLDGKLTMTLAAVGKAAKVGISAANHFRVISNQLSTDYSAHFTGDSVYQTVILKDGALYLTAAAGHEHCVCNGAASGCDHTKGVWAAWESTTGLPTTSGNYYLLADVQLTGAVTVSGDVNLCLNGKTVTAAQGARIMTIGQDASVSITDCQEIAGAVTGGSGTWGAAFNVNSGAELHLYHGKITGNGNTVGTEAGSGGIGAIYLQAGKLDGSTAIPGGILNMYGGEISGNSGKSSGAIYMAGGAEGTTPSTFNMYAGTITGNTSTANAGAIYGNAGSVINLQGGQITGNTAARDGGAVYAADRSKVALGAVTFSQNKAEGQGGALAVYTASTMTIGKDTLISGNSAQTGGGIVTNGAGTLVTMNGGRISGNTAQNGGGVITLTKSTFTMKDGTVSGNKAAAGAGGVYVSATSFFNMEGGTISGNEAQNGGGLYLLRSTGTFTGGVIEENKATDGGGMFVGGATVTLNGTAICKNAASGNGGGIRSNPSTVTDSKTGEKTVYCVTITFTGGSISENTAAKVGGGVVVQGEGSVMTMDGGEVTGNSAQNGGGIITQTKSALVFKDGTISKNAASSGGGGLYISTNTEFKMEGGTVTGNTANNGAGAYLLRSKSTVSGGSITGNTAKSNGAGVYADRTEAVFSGGGISGNTAAKNGVGLYITGSTVTLSGVKVQNNTTEEGYGGGLFVNARTVTTNGVKTTTNSKVTMTGGSISGNSAAHGGGVMLNSKETVFSMSGGSIEDNKVAKNGGGIYVSSSTTFNMSGGVIAGNASQSNGGGIYHLRSTGNYTGGEIRNNATETRAAGMLINGEASVVTMKNVTFTGNTAKSGGGAVVCQNKATLNMEDCEIFRNTAGGVGGGMSVDKNSFANLTDTRFYENTAGDSAGAFYNAVTTNVTMTRVVITDNKATGYGGGIYCRGNLTITDSEITGNTTDGDGGGISTWKMGAAGAGKQPGLQIENTRIDGNTSGGQGGGIFLHVGSIATLRDVTITGNKAAAEGGALWAVDDLTMHSVIATGNTSGGEGYAVYLAASNYDGHSYFTGVMKMSGDMQVNSNTNGDMYLGERTSLTITAEGLGQTANVSITLDSGLLTRRVYGLYNYEGSSCVYTITQGDRSMTDPEIAPVSEAVEPTEGTDATEATEPANENTLLYAGVGAFAVVIAAVAVIVVMVNRKKKKAEETAAETTQE